MALHKFALIYMGLMEFLQEQNAAAAGLGRAYCSRQPITSATGQSQLKTQTRIVALRQEIPRVEAWLQRLETIEATWKQQVALPLPWTGSRSVPSVLSDC